MKYFYLSVLRYPNGVFQVECERFLRSRFTVSLINIPTVYVKHLCNIWGWHLFSVSGRQILILVGDPCVSPSEHSSQIAKHNSINSWSREYKFECECNMCFRFKVHSHQARAN